MFWALADETIFAPILSLFTKAPGGALTLLPLQLGSVEAAEQEI